MLLITAMLSFLAGGVAAIAGFGIGSLLTPWFEARLGLHVAVAAVAVPHFAGTLLRCWRMRREIDRPLLVRFGLASAAGGLLGAILQPMLRTQWLTLLFAGLLIFSGLAGLTGLARRMQFRGLLAWGAGVLSGVFGGLVGNQGGIRSAALMGFDVRREAFVATATAVGLIIDVIRVPIYMGRSGAVLAADWPELLAASVGVLAGTLLGERLLRKMPEEVFRPVVSILILLLGVYMLGRAARLV